MKSRIVLITTILLAVGLSSAFAQQTGRIAGPRFAEQRQKFLEQLKLTDAQKKELQQIRFNAQKQAIGQRAKIATTALELRQLLRAESPDKAAIEKKVKELSDLRGQAQLARIDHLFAARKVLTPEQQKLVRERIGPWLEHRRMGRMYGMRHPMTGLGLRERLHQRLERFRDFDPFDE
jgi:Spy/CpxP family protein refolding chaperone